MTSTIHKIPVHAKTFKQNGKYIMPWSVAEFQAAVRKYLRIGGFAARDNDSKFNEFAQAIRSINPHRSDDSIYMVFFNIARCDKQVIDSYNLYGGNSHLLMSVLKAMDPNEIRFTQNPA
jgi:O-acetylhomoserine/O-acetylserine sulfhydrylase-like pyridoxal-dependent enzyme